jgi:hypothetical protein
MIGVFCKNNRSCGSGRISLCSSKIHISKACGKNFYSFKRIKEKEKKITPQTNSKCISSKSK